MPETKAIYNLTVSRQFYDAEEHCKRDKSDEFCLDNARRAKFLIKNGFAQLNSIKHDKETKPEDRVIVYSSRLARIGGIETAIKNMAEEFTEVPFQFIIYSYDDIESLFDLGKHHDLIVDNGVTNKYKGKVLLIESFDAAGLVGDRFDVKQIYEFSHCDWRGLVDHGTKMKLSIHPKAKFIAVSDTCQKGLKSVYGISSTVIPNILKAPKRDRLVFVMLSRASSEKGIDVLLEFINRCEDAGKDFVVFLSSTIFQAEPEMQRRITNCSRIVIVHPSRYSQELLRMADYLVQFSATESYCFSVHEAIASGVPVLCSKIPEFKKIVKQGKNGYMFERDLSDLDIDAVFNKIPKFEGKDEPYDKETWNKLFEGKL